jgi:hypothetical protein
MDSLAKLTGICWLAAGVVYYIALMLALKKPVALEIS